MKKNKAIAKETERYSTGIYIVLSETTMSVMMRDTSTKVSKIPNILQQINKPNKDKVVFTPIGRLTSAQ